MRLRGVVGISITTGWVVALAAAIWIGCSSPRAAEAIDEDGGGASDGAAGEDASPSKPGDAGGSAREGGCTAITGACDLVLQDCADDAKGRTQECVVTEAEGALTTACVPVQASQQLPMGRACCPGAANPCLPGLTCVGDLCADGGPMTGRCTPACCAGDHAACGQSDPEGIGGRCDVVLYSDSSELHSVCSYRERCKPFGVEPCRSGQLCMVEDTAGAATCIRSNEKGLREPCTFANDCADGLVCAGAAGAGSCRMACLDPGSTPPFDASALDGTPGHGGCPSGEACTGPRFSNLPDWYRLCELPDGG